MDSKQPPYNLEAEQSIIGSILIDNESIAKCSKKITPKDFYHHKHELIYEAIEELSNENIPIDLIMLRDKLVKKHGEEKLLNNIGGISYIMSLINVVPTASHIEHYAEIVKQHSIKRTVNSKLVELKEKLNDEDADVRKLISDLDLQLSQEYKDGDDYAEMNEVLTNILTEVAIMKNTFSIEGLRSGFKKLDSILSGFQKNNLIILAARPSVGKTALALTFSLNVAKYNNKAVIIFSYEMSKDEIMKRLMCGYANVDIKRIKQKRLLSNSDNKERYDDRQRLAFAYSKLSQHKIVIDDNPANKLSDIRNKIKEIKKKYDVGMVVVDYLQLIEHSRKYKSDNKTTEITEISQGLKRLAMEFELPFIALSQLSRQCEQRKPAVPQLSDLRDSGALEQDADIVMFIYRKDVDPHFKKNTHQLEESIAQLNIAKNRHGELGDIQMYFNKPATTFYELP